jgi:hypothetical protein
MIDTDITMCHSPAVANTRLHVYSVYGSPKGDYPLHNFVQRNPLDHGAVPQTLHELYQVDTQLGLGLDLEEDRVHLARVEVCLGDQANIPATLQPQLCFSWHWDCVFLAMVLDVDMQCMSLPIAQCMQNYTRH